MRLLPLYKHLRKQISGTNDGEMKREFSMRFQFAFIDRLVRLIAPIQVLNVCEEIDEGI